MSISSSFKRIKYVIAKWASDFKHFTYYLGKQTNWQYLTFNHVKLSTNDIISIVWTETKLSDVLLSLFYKKQIR